jgi:hypothetical protein
MTSTKVNFILSELNTQFSEGGTLYGPNIWLEAEHISAIILESDESVYPDRTMQVKFDSTNGLLLTRKGYYIDGVFTATENNAAYDYDLILGITLDRSDRRKSPYMFARSV